jgi:hypothetical protein
MVFRNWIFFLCCKDLAISSSFRAIFSLSYVCRAPSGHRSSRAVDLVPVPDRFFQRTLCMGQDHNFSQDTAVLPFAKQTSDRCLIGRREVRIIGELETRNKNRKFIRHAPTLTMISRSWSVHRLQYYSDTTHSQSL